MAESKNGKLAKLKRISQLETIVQPLRIPAKIVSFFAVLALGMSAMALLIGIVSCLTIYGKADWGFWAWLLPLLLCGLPAMVMAVYWYALSTIAGIPETLLSLKGRVKEGFTENIQRVIKKQNDGKRKTFISSLRLLWHTFMAMGEVDDVFLAGTMVAFVISPIGWLVTLVLLAWFAMGSLAMLISTAVLLFL